MLIQEMPYALMIIVLVFITLYISNVTLDYGTPHYISRKITHFGGGCGYLASAFLFSSAVWPLIISGGFMLLLVGARLLRPQTFRGVGGTGRQGAAAELWFPLTGTISIAVGWLWLGNPFLGILPALFLSFGDCVTGLVRSAVYKKEVKGNWGSVAMFGICALVAYLLTPYWIGFVGAFVASTVEKYTVTKHWIDDNLTLTLASLAAMAPLYYYVGG